MANIVNNLPQSILDNFHDGVVITIQWLLGLAHFLYVGQQWINFLIQALILFAMRKWLQLGYWGRRITILIIALSLAYPTLLFFQMAFKVHLWALLLLFGPTPSPAMTWTLSFDRSVHSTSLGTSSFSPASLVVLEPAWHTHAGADQKLSTLHDLKDHYQRPYYHTSGAYGHLLGYSFPYRYHVRGDVDSYTAVSAHRINDVTETWANTKIQMEGTSVSHLASFDLEPAPWNENELSTTMLHLDGVAISPELGNVLSVSKLIDSGVEVTMIDGRTIVLRWGWTHEKVEKKPKREGGLGAWVNDPPRPTYKVTQEEGRKLSMQGGSIVVRKEIRGGTDKWTVQLGVAKECKSRRLGEFGGGCLEGGRYLKPW